MDRQPLGNRLLYVIIGALFAVAGASFLAQCATG
jgi:hypothetical protein